MALFVQNQDLTVELSEFLAEPIQAFLLALPELVGALLILLIGWIVGRVIGGAVMRLVDRSGLDRKTMSTPLGKVMGGTEGAVTRTLGKIAKWFIYALAILAAASLLDIAILSRWISRALTYLPSFIAGLLVILIGFIVADFIGDLVENTEAATRTGYTQYFADGLRIFLYFVAVTVGLDTMGIDVGLLYIFAQAAAWGLALGIALALGIGFGWGMKDYVADNIGDWSSRAREKSSD